jgi:hypothetical protein
MHISFFQVSDVGHAGIKVRFLYAPYPKKRSIWKLPEDNTTYSADVEDITMVLDEPEIIKHRTGDIYLKFKSLPDF